MGLDPVSHNIPPPVQAAPAAATDNPPSKTCCIFTRCCSSNTCLSTLNLRIKKISTNLCSCIKRVCAKIWHAISSFFRLLWPRSSPPPQKEISSTDLKEKTLPIPRELSIIPEPSPRYDDLGWKEVKTRESITKDINTNGRWKVAIESATPIPTRDAARQRLLKAQRMLQQEPNSYKKNVLLETCTKALRSVQREQDWIHSSGIRETFERGKPEEFAFVEQPNCYQHGIEINDSDSSHHYKLLRLGTIVHTNGFTDLETLEKAVQDESSIQTDPETSPKATQEDSPIKEKITRLEQILDRGFFVKKKMPLTEHQKRALELAIIDLKDPRKTLIERRFLFEQQMLFLINHQVQSCPPQADSDSFILWHQALLNPSKKKFEKEGWMHDEKRELKDLAFIFNEFNERTICFGTKETVPYIGKRGTIHLPAPDGVKIGKRVTLKTRLINISVQNHKKHAIAFQQKINGVFRQKFEELFITQAKKLLNIETNSIDGLRNTLSTEQWRGQNQIDWINLQKIKTCISIYEDICRTLDKTKSQKSPCFDLATKVALIPCLLQVPFSTGCLSAKDRSGYICGRLMTDLTMHHCQARKDFVEEQMGSNRDNYEKYKKAAALYGGDVNDLRDSHQALDENSIAMQIVRANCPNQKHLKVMVFPITTAPLQALSHGKRYLTSPKNPD